MKARASFTKVLEAADRLDLEEQVHLIKILRRRIIDQRREAMAAEIREARAEYRAGNATPRSPQELIEEILG